MPYKKETSPGKCPVCGSDANVGNDFLSYIVECSRSGDFEVPSP